MEEALIPCSAPPQLICDIGFKAGEFDWPAHVIEFVNEHKGVGGVMTLDEFTALLAHIVLLEMGFVPSFVVIDPTKHIQDFIRDKSILNRVKALLARIPETTRVATAFIFDYYGIRGCDEEESDEDISPKPEENPRPSSFSFKYEFTKPISVTYCFEDHGLVIFGIHGRPNEGANLKLDIRNYIDPIGNLSFEPNVKLSGKQWLNVIRLRGCKFTEAVRDSIGYPLLDYAFGISLRARFQDLPNETLEKISSYLKKNELLNLRLVSTQYKSVAEYNLVKWYKSTVGEMVEGEKLRRQQQEADLLLRRRPRNVRSLWYLFR